MRIPAKVNREPLEYRVNRRNMVINTQSIYEPYTEVLEAFERRKHKKHNI